MKKSSFPHRMKRQVLWLLTGGGLAYQVASRDKVFLTFDDGPHSVNTEKILNILRTHKARATFFVVGESAERYPELVRRIVAEGHGIAGHSWSHEKTRFWDFAGAWREIDRTREALRRLSGLASSAYRPPYGKMAVPLMLYALFRKIHVWLWSLDSEDDQRKSIPVILENCRRAQPGDVVLFHDDSDAAVDAFSEVLREMRGRGLRFGVLPDQRGKSSAA